MELLLWLQNWYQQNCDGYWEHLYGITIGNIDNPGWTVRIDLDDTPYEDKFFHKIERENGESWLVCEKQDTKFKGYGSSDNLYEILNIFKLWIEDKL